MGFQNQLWLNRKFGLRKRPSRAFQRQFMWMMKEGETEQTDTIAENMGPGAIMIFAVPSHIKFEGEGFGMAQKELGLYAEVCILKVALRRASCGHLYQEVTSIVTAMKKIKPQESEDEERRATCGRAERRAFSEAE